MAQQDLLQGDLTDQIIKAIYHVYNTHGYGFLEKVYEKAMLLTLEKWGVPAQAQFPIKVFFEGQQVGEYFADLLIDWRVIIELKAVQHLDSAHEAQLLNYLKATDIEVGLLLNFGAKPEFRRKIFSNSRKQLRPCDIPEKNP
jgi:GxxExxY protein